jgi:lipoyl(octanoyl) transferase
MANTSFVNKEIIVQDWGLVDYQQAWQQQTALFNSIDAIKRANQSATRAVPQPTPNYLVICEHPPVYTLGKVSDTQHLLVSEEYIKQQGAAVFYVNRGGAVTFHGLGQLVIYLVLDLENFCKDVHGYLRLLEQAVHATLVDFGLSTSVRPGLTGVWVGSDEEGWYKICAIGIRLARWITMHGLALNVATDVTYFDRIIPCGIEGGRITSMERVLGYPVDIESVRDCLVKHLCGLLKAWSG